MPFTPFVGKSIGWFAVRFFPKIHPKCRTKSRHLGKKFISFSQILSLQRWFLLLSDSKKVHLLHDFQPFESHLLTLLIMSFAAVFTAAFIAEPVTVPPPPIWAA